MISNGSAADTSPAVATVRFSPTGTTERITNSIAIGMGQSTPIQRNVTLPQQRIGFAEWVANNALNFDYWIFGIPVYAGRVPRIAYETLTQMQVKDQLAVSCVVYGNNEYGMALKELTALLEGAGFKIAGAAAFIAEHSFSAKFPIAIGRPDDQDTSAAMQFGRNVGAKERSSDSISSQELRGKMKFSTRVLPDKGPKPTVDHAQCVKCQICVEHCPMGIIAADTIEFLNADAAKLCLGCMSCVKRCPENARSYEIPSLMTPILNRVFREAKSVRHEPVTVY